MRTSGANRMSPATYFGGNRNGNNNNKGGIPAHIAERNAKRKETAK